MTYNALCENVLGTIGTVLWSGQILPQIWKSWREKSTLGLSGLLMFIWATSAVFLGVYNIVQNINIPLIVQPQLFGALAALSWVQCLYYQNKKSLRFCVIVYLSYLVIFAGFEAGVTYGARALSRHTDEPGKRFTQFFGIFSAVLVSVGLIPQYIEIYKLKEVIGISLLFLAIDMSGGVFSLLSLVFRETFDVTASVTYIAVVVLDGVVVVCAVILNPRARRRREEAAAAACIAPMTSTPPVPLSVTGNSPPSVPLVAIDLERGDLPSKRGPEATIHVDSISPPASRASTPYRDPRDAPVSIPTS